MNGVIALILRYLTESLEADYVTVVEDKPVMSAEASSTFGQNWPTQQSHGLSAIVELVVQLVYNFLLYCHFPT